MKKVIILGLDGATFDVIKNKADEFQLNNFKKILKQGSCGILKSTIPFLTVPAWPSFYTGMNPGKHGIFHFLTTHKFEPKDRKVHTSNDVEAKSLWKLLSEQSKKCLVWNVPMTFPPEEINGKMVAGMLSVPEKTFAWPMDFEQELRDQKYVIGAMHLDFRKQSKSERFKTMLKVDADRHDIWKKYYLKEKYDFSMIVYRSSDIVGHDFWEDKEKVKLTYQDLDRMTGDVINFMDKDTTLILMSDHGFGDYDKTFNMLAWLENEGYLQYKKSDDKDVTSKGWRQLKEGEGKRKKTLVGKLLNIVGLDRQKLYRNKLIDSVSKYIPRSLKNVVRKNIASSKTTIDWGQTRVYAELGSKYSWGININLRNRETNGIVDEEKFEDLKKEIINKLRNLKDEDDQYIFDKVFLGNEIYSGQYKGRGTDILFTMRNKRNLTVSRFDNEIWGETTSHTHSYHTPDGIFMAYGQGIKKGLELRPLSILDVAPTVLNCMNVNIPEEMDGKVISTIFKPGVNLNNLASNLTATMDDNSR